VVAAMHCSWAPHGSAWQFDEDELGGGSGAWNRAFSAGAVPVEKIELKGSSPAQHRRIDS
jgi:hypothetical protein